MATDYVGKPVSNLVYVIVGDREKFDLIPLPEIEGDSGGVGRVLAKTVGDFGAEGVTVVFQHWPDGVQV